MNISEFCEVSKVKAMLYLQECMFVHLLTSQYFSVTHTSIPDLAKELHFVSVSVPAVGIASMGRLHCCVFLNILLLALFLHEMIVPGIFLVGTKYSE
jgi:hypothetical protein